MGHGKMGVRILKSVHSKCFKTNRFFYCGGSDPGVGGWVTINPNIVRIFKSVGINGRSLTRVALIPTRPQSLRCKM